MWIGVRPYACREIQRNRFTGSVEALSKLTQMKRLYVGAGAEGCWVCNRTMFVFNARVGFVLASDCWVRVGQLLGVHLRVTQATW